MKNNPFSAHVLDLFAFSAPRFVGVRRLKSGYQARIRVNGSRTTLGVFPSAKQAALAYDDAAKVLGRKKLNFR